jgi:DNA-binding PadR family transcriptional regulator
VSTTRLLVLGCVRIFQPVHGYDVRRELMQWHADEWAHAAPGSIYSALKTLVKDGMLEVVGTAAVGARPERTSYKLTVHGEDELRTLLHATWWNVATLADPLVGALSLMGFVSRTEMLAALEHRRATIETMLKHHDFLIAGVDNKTKPAHVREMMRLINARLASELAWSDAFAKRLRAGEYATSDDPPWQVYDKPIAKPKRAKPAKPAKPRAKRRRA